MQISKRVLQIILAAFLVLQGTCTCVYAGLSGRIESVLSQKHLQKVRFGIQVTDAKTGKSLYSRSARNQFIPASNMKLVVSAAAVHYLGGNYDFSTKIGVHENKMIILGGGDPLLGDPVMLEKYNRPADFVLDKIVAAVKQQGIAKLAGVIVDSTFFDDQLVHPNWPGDQLNRWYACEVSGINYNANCIEVTCKKVGSICRVSYAPRTSYVKILDKTRAKPSGATQVGSYRNGQANHITVFGKCNSPATFEVAIERPAAFFGFVTAEYLGKNGIEVWGELVEMHFTDRQQAKWIHEFKTPIGDVLKRCNEDSMGLAADALVKTISAENKPGKVNGSWEHGLELTGEYLKKIGVMASEFRMDDGRGLSRENRLSPNSLTRAILDMYQGRYWYVFEESLAEGGREGTVSRYFKQEQYRGKVLGKTGYISGVRSFSGICETGRGPVIFSILSEGGSSSVRTAINDIVK